MLQKLKDLWHRIEVRWSVVLLALVAALPNVLDWLGVIDIRPALEWLHVSPSWTNFIVSSMPFFLMFMRKIVILAPKEDPQ
jgi:hypothetical protein